MTRILYRFVKNERMRFAPFLFFSALLLLAACGGSVQRPVADPMKISRDSSTYTTVSWIDSVSRDFGSIAEGQKLQVSFRFVNTGTKPLIIQQVHASCGCTVAEQPEEPVLPGKEGTIRASFNSEGKPGHNSKTLYVIANTKGSQSTELHFTVNVEKKKW
jgi:hypothetical protein